MLPQKGCVHISDQANKRQEGSMRSESCKHVMSGKESITDCSVSESGQTESGYLSSTNISSSGTFLSGEITPPSPKTEYSGYETDTKSYMRLDSDVGIGLSDHFSELCIEESQHDLSCDLKHEGNIEDAYHSTQNVPSSVKSGNRQLTGVGEENFPNGTWELYFQQDEEGDSQLHIAVIQEFNEVVYSLITMIPNSTLLDIPNDLRQTGLHLAVLTSQPRIVRTLVCAGARTDVVDRNGNTPLHLATAAGDCDCLRALTEPISLAETDSLGLHYVPQQRSSPLPEIDMYNYEGLSCVHIAALTGNIDILRHLYWLRADINAREWKSGRTALHLAVEMENMKLAETLVQKMGAQVDAITYAGHSVCKLARENPEFFSLLKKIGIPQDYDYSSSEDDEDDAESHLQMMEQPFRDHHTNGGIVNATA